MIPMTYRGCLTVALAVSLAACAHTAGRQTSTSTPCVRRLPDVSRANAALLVVSGEGDSDAGTRIADAIARLPPAGGIVDATALQGTQSIAIDVFGGTTKAGRLLLGQATFNVSATQNVPSNWEILGIAGARVDGTPRAHGTELVAAPKFGRLPLLRYLNTQFTKTTGVYVNCRGLTGTTGILVDADGPPFSHDNVFENLSIEGCQVGMQWGTSGAKGYQSDGIVLRNFRFYDNATAGLVVDAQNAGQDSVVERGSILMTGTSDGIVLDYSPLNFSIRNVSIGNTLGNSGVGLHAAYPRASGGAPLYVEACEFEMLGASSAFKLDADSTTNATFVFMGNAFGGAKGQNIVKLDAISHVVSIGNNFGYGTALVGADSVDVTSIGDFFEPARSGGSGWVAAPGKRMALVSLGRADGLLDLGRLVMTSPDVSGTLAVSGTSASVRFAQPYVAVPRVLVTPLRDPGGSFWVVPTTSGFSVNTSVPVKDLAFDYLVLGASQ